MKINEKKKQNLYAAISGNITDLRVDIERDVKIAHLRGSMDLDRRLFDLQSQIWREVCQAFYIPNP